MCGDLKTKSCMHKKYFDLGDRGKIFYHRKLISKCVYLFIEITDVLYYWQKQYKIIHTTFSWSSMVSG